MSSIEIEQFKAGKYTQKGALGANDAIQNIYGYTNENLRQYIRLLNIAGGRVATVGSSGDQVLYSIFHDAEEVTLIDANPYCKPMVELKMSAIKNMSRDEFVRYWTYENVLQRGIYRDLLQDVSSRTREFLEVVEEARQYSGYDCVAGIVVKPRSFNDWSKLSYSKACEFYDDEQTYNLLKSKLEKNKVKYVYAELSQFHKKLEGKYSSILLSNVLDYVDEEDYCNAVENLRDNHLASDGTMQMHYEMQYPVVQDIVKDIAPSLVGAYKTYLVRKIVAEGDLSTEYPRQRCEEGIMKSDEEMVYIIGS